MSLKLKIIPALIFGLMAGGCSSIDEHFATHVEKEPTLGSLQWSSNDAKIYLRTMYVQADFNSDGTKRLFNDYDYKVETSPCTAFTKYSPRTNLFTVEHEGKHLTFECRAYFGYEKPDMRRLYLLGSKIDCEDRTWDYVVPVLDSKENANLMCKKKSKENSIKNIEKRYDDWKAKGVFK